MNASPDRFDEPTPVRRHEDAFAAQLDAARLADADIPARVIEPRGPSAFGGRGLAIVMVPADRVAEAIAVLESPAAAEDPGGGEDGDGGDPTSVHDDVPFAAAPMPPLARLGLWLAALAIALGILGGLASLL